MDRRRANSPEHILHNMGSDTKKPVETPLLRIEKRIEAKSLRERLSFPPLKLESYRNE